MKAILWSILKIACFLLIVPLLAAFVIAFQNRILSLPAHQSACLLWGAGVYVAANLFIYDFKKAHDLGKNLVEKMTAFFKPAAYVVPAYALVAILIYVVAVALGRGSAIQPYFLFVLGFAFTMHLVLTAHEIYGSDNSFFKSEYLIIFPAVFMASLIIMSLLLAMLLREYSFVGFFKSLASHAAHFYQTFYRFLFVDS
ncbi:MAG: hypothetical protein KGI24_09680 [Candidatus Omnitrophica bacterium]|nr:hypothetical protein [Candidatus Omnitrophota bacterium]MDE2215361.1 hypothetical protein [Candidatus Omnitrophota bacterium]